MKKNLIIFGATLYLGLAWAGTGLAAHGHTETTSRPPIQMVVSTSDLATTIPALAPIPSARVVAVIPAPLKAVGDRRVAIGQNIEALNYLGPTNLYAVHGLSPQATHRAYALAGLLAIIGLSALRYGRKQ